MTRYQEEETKPPQRSKTIWVGAIETLAGLGEVAIGVVDEPLLGAVLMVSGIAKILLRFVSKVPIEV